MSLSIRYWLAEHKIELAQLRTPSSLATGVAFRLVQEMQVKSLTPFDFSPFAEVLELPLGGAWPEIKPLSQLTVELLRILSRKKPLKRNEGTWLAFQIAYLRALEKVLEQEYILRRPWLDRSSVLAAARSEQDSPTLSDPALQALVKTLRPGRLSDTQAEQALSQVAESFLVQQMNNLAIAWLITNGAEETEARLIVQRLNHGLPGYVLAVVAENALPLAQLQRFFRLGNLTPVREAVIRSSTMNQSLTERETLELIEEEAELASLGVSSLPPNPLDLEREYYRASLLQDFSEPLLGTLFALKDLYVPLKGQEVRGEASETPTSFVDVMTWVTNQLADLQSVAVIEAPPGHGKTSFCQMLAAKVSQELYPSWMPVLIRLRDATLGHTLEQTLDTAFPEGRLTCADGWLSPLYPPCLLLLDGLDELPRSPQTERHLSTFLDQVSQFLIQSNSGKNRPRHKIVLTCRDRTLVGTYSTTPLQARSLSAQFCRIAIQPFEQNELKQWFKQWSKLQSKSIAQNYFNFLKQNGIFHYRLEVREFSVLVHQPLMLFLLGILHRDGRLDETIFPLMGAQIRFEIYDRLCRWLLGEAPDGMSTGDKMPLPVREGFAHASRSPEAIANLLQGQSSQELRYQMQEAALTLLKNARHCCTTATLAQILQDGSQIDENVNSTSLAIANPPSPLSNLHYPAAWLPALYFNARPQTATFLMEFSHANLGEYLAAEAIAQQLTTLTQKVPDTYGEVTFAINSWAEVAQHLYNLLSFGILSPEMEEIIVERLRREEARDRLSFSFAVLCDRLYRFYRSYCRGRWMDEGIAHTARSQLLTLSNTLNASQVDAAVGLNVFLLLCVCHRTAQIMFWPCGDPDIPEEFNPDQLLTLIGRTTVLSPIAFWQRVKYSLSQISLAKTCLHHVMLAEANCWKTDLFAAELVGANLTNANLQEANLSWANLSHANLSGANLSAAKLEGANLTGANLQGANLQLASLTNACLFQAQMDEVTKRFAAENGALFSLQQYQVCQQALASWEITRTARVKPIEEEAESTLLLIERSAGSGVSGSVSETDNLNEETIVLE